MLEKSDAQNIAACENQDKQVNWVITKNQLKHCFWNKITCKDAKNTKRLSGIQVLTKDFTFYKIRYKYLRKSK